MLAAMAKSGARRIVFVSSAHVYGMQRAGTAPAGEHDELNPLAPWAVTKLEPKRCWPRPEQNGWPSGRRSSSAVMSTTGCSGCWRARCFPILTDRRAGGCRWCTPTTPFGYLPGRVGYRHR
ncbi:NAD dependent epimerase/dehydratase family protein [Mycobacterium xenopi 4042]|uniref:NAD dependent epimerase/dehydratase family protein n=1 Tax=Mycobacterium xenopi 4042 TaxID=1299334 RepID=X8BFL0_MYCXE|nr:NAD dependent epimerase/dehydratase family protein [Mycobacterium xenopi 4042]